MVDVMGGPLEPPEPPQRQRGRRPVGTAEVMAKAEEAARLRAEGLTLAEIAKRLGHSVPYVSTLVKRAAGTAI
jgi:DNA-binding CsgD family transcriptional regulator